MTTYSIASSSDLQMRVQASRSKWPKTTIFVNACFSIRASIHSAFAPYGHGMATCFCNCHELLQKHVAMPWPYGAKAE